MGEALDELLNISATIMQLDAAEASLGKGREWKAAKKEYDAAVQKFVERRKSYIDGVLLDGEDWTKIPEDVADELRAIEERADPSWHPAIEYTRENLLPELTREAQKKPWLRKVVKRAPVAIGVALALAYLGVRFTSGVDVSAPLESQLGLRQRAAATEKVIRYDDWMDTRVRRGGWLKGLMLWPIEPSETEIRAAGEFVSLALGAYTSLAERQEICGTLVDGYDDKLSDEQIKFLDEIAEEVQRGGIRWETPPPMTLVRLIKAKYAC